MGRVSHQQEQRALEMAAAGYSLSSIAAALNVNGVAAQLILERARFGPPAPDRMVRSRDPWRHWRYGYEDKRV